MVRHVIEDDFETAAMGLLQKMVKILQRPK